MTAYRSLEANPPPVLPNKSSFAPVAKLAHYLRRVNSGAKGVGAGKGAGMGESSDGGGAGILGASMTH